MDSLSIGRVKARYHLAPAQQDQRPRLDRLLRETLDEPLELAVDLARQRLGIGAHELLCIRRLRVPLRLRLSRGDRELITAWSLGLADAIETQIAARDDSHGLLVVRYRSHSQALQAFALAVARGKHELAWAWRQLGLTQGEQLNSPAEAAEALMGALKQRPEAIVGVLRGVADAGLLPRLAAAMRAAWWRPLADLALQAAGLSAPRIPALSSASPLGPGAGWVIATPLAQAFADCADKLVARGVALDACAALAALDAEPGLASDPARAGGLVWAIARRLEEAAGDSALQAEVRGDSPPVNEQPYDSPPGHPHSAPGAGAGTGTPPAEPASGMTHEPPPEPDAGAPATGSPALGPTTTAPANDSPMPGAPSDALPGLTEATAVTPPPAKANDTAPRPPAAPQSLHTHYAGLLFLIPILQQLALPQAMAADPLLAGRPLRLGLHRLGLALAGCRGDDPALATFCGLVPGAKPPWSPDDLQDPALGERVEDWAEHLRQALGQTLDNEEQDPRLRLARLLQRDARVVAEPGWIELHLSLDQVSVDVRRAGLDLDPGWVPWLGVVIRYVYE